MCIQHFSFSSVVVVFFFKHMSFLMKEKNLLILFKTSKCIIFFCMKGKYKRGVAFYFITYVMNRSSTHTHSLLIDCKQQETERVHSERMSKCNHKLLFNKTSDTQQMN